MRGACSAKRPNSGVAVGVQFEGNSKEEEVAVLYVGAVKDGSRSVPNMTCERCEDFFKMTRTEMLQSKHLIESRQTLSHTHEKKKKKNARVVVCLHTPRR